MLIEGPLKAADFLFMPDKLALKVVFSSQIPMQDAFVSGASAQEFAIPGYRSNSAIVPVQCSDHTLFTRIPDLELSPIGAYRQ